MQDSLMQWDLAAYPCRLNRATKVNTGMREKYIQGLILSYHSCRFPQLLLSDQIYIHNACKYGATQGVMESVKKQFVRGRHRHRGLTSKVARCQVVQASSL